MIETKVDRSFTLLAECKCGWVSVTRCANRGIAIKELDKIHFCPNCLANDLIFMLKKGQYKSDELKEAIKKEVIKG